MPVHFGMLTAPPIARHVLRHTFGYPDFRLMQARVVFRTVEES